MSRIIFVTGTDTGVGKTLVTALLLQHLRQNGVRALAMKPFCSGGRGDVRILQALQRGELPDDMMNPFYFAEPLAPLVAARMHKRTIVLKQVLDAVSRVQERCDCLIVEGAGGVLVPLGEDYNVADFIAKLKCDTIVVARDKLGTINHTLLSIEALGKRGVVKIKIVLSGEKRREKSAQSNKAIIAESAANIDVLSLPHVGENGGRKEVLKEGAKKMKKTLAQILHPDTFTPRSRRRVKAAKRTN